MAAFNLLLLVLTTWVAILGLVSAQDGTVLPSNDTSSTAAEMPAPGTAQLILKTMQTGMTTQVNVDPLTTSAGAGNSLTQLQNIHFTGRLVLITPFNANSNIYGAIAYISCDPEAYTGNITPYQTVHLAANQSPSAILLYSNTSNHCTFQAVINLGYDVIFTMTSPINSAQLASSLMGSPVTDLVTMITLDQNSLKNSTNSTGGGGGDVLGPSPTTAVAMIILYSITGIITALFLVIIITGALRAHRHPERYGPRNVLGRPRQSRAKGIARAMLETLPIVKFGDHEEVKPAANNGDIEMGGARTTENVQALPRDVAQRTCMAGATQEDQSHEGIVVNTTTAEGAIGAAEAPKTDEGEEYKTDNGLACSVCTDDFIKGQDIRLLPCNHKFHPECIDPWLLNVSGTCPLCRVDLRDPTDLEQEDHAPESADGNGSLSTDADNATNPEISTTQRSHRNGLSSYLHHTLNIRRMRDATPEERIAALRRLRTANRANNRQSVGETNENETARNRLSSRFRDALRRDSSIGTAAAQR